MQRLLRNAKAGRLPACSQCPSSPRWFANPAFGESCRCHGLDWSSSASAVSMMVVRDPAGTTPSTNGRLCFVCNSESPTDRTAKHAFALWRAAVACADERPASLHYLDRHYWTNAAMHGSDKSRLERARRCCTAVLRDQVAVLSPTVIVASGVEAVTSLQEIGLLKKQWSDLRGHLVAGAYSEAVTLPSGARGAVFCTYHTAATAVNCVVSKLYSDSTERLLTQRRDELSEAGAFNSFLDQYRADSAEGRGMRVLLLHWFDIGEAIRGANHQAA